MPPTSASSPPSLATTSPRSSPPPPAPLATTAVTLNEANKYATAAGATLSVYKACSAMAAYAAGWGSGVVVGPNGTDPGWVAPSIGQLVAFGTGGGRVNYTVIESYSSGTNQQTIILDRPLVNAINNANLAFPGPAGAMNMAFHRNALALVTRPLAIPNNAMGVLCTSVSTTTSPCGFRCSTASPTAARWSTSTSSLAWPSWTPTWLSFCKAKPSAGPPWTLTLYI